MMRAKSSLKVRAAINKWIMLNFPEHRKYLSHTTPSICPETGAWQSDICSKNINGHSVTLSTVKVGHDNKIIETPKFSKIISQIENLLKEYLNENVYGQSFQGEAYSFFNADGVEAATGFADRSISLLLTDPPYGISKPYTCENQIPRRLRTSGRDFIMPKGNFGTWDVAIDPEAWLNVVLPKISGWAVSFCAQSQIGEYQRCLERHKFVGIGTIVWQKTNPVPFNHKYKPINAWEAIVVGKRPGAKFNGDGVVHNVFKHKSPSPQTRIHSTQKPLELIEEFVRLFSQPNDRVFDPFSGSATTILAAARAGRVGLGYEADATIYQLACKRLEDEIG